MSVTELPESLEGFGPAGIQHAIAERRERAKAIFARDPSAATAADVKEANRLNDELARLNEFADGPAPLKSMIHPLPAGQFSSRHSDRSKFGRVEGLGSEFIKQVGTKVLDGTSGGATMPGAWFDPRLRELPQRKLFVRSLIPTSRVTSDKVAYIRQTVLTNNAAAVAAGALKPTSVITAAREEAPIRVIAHLSEALDRSMLSDYDQLTGFVDSQLRLGVLLEEERQILLGDGTAPNISGFLDQAGLQTQAKGADPTPDAIHKAITKIRVVFGEPDGVVLHPNDWQEISLLRSADGHYIWGSPHDQAELSIWGLKVVVSPVMTEGTALVGAFGTAAEVFEREGARVTFAESGLGDSAGQELFSRNQIRMRGESRIGLAVIRPDQFCSVTGV